MSTLKNFIAGFPLYFHASCLSADIFKCWLHWCRWLKYFTLTESAFSCFFIFFELLAWFADMVRFSLTLWTEVLLATPTSNSKFTHMYCCFLRDQLSIFILLVFLNLARYYLHNIATTTVNKVLVLGQQLHLF